MVGEQPRSARTRRLVDTEVGERAVVGSSVCRRAVIGADARVGPFAVLDEGTEVPAGGVVGPGAI